MKVIVLVLVFGCSAFASVPPLYRSMNKVEAAFEAITEANQSTNVINGSIQEVKLLGNYGDIVKIKTSNCEGLVRIKVITRTDDSGRPVMGPTKFSGEVISNECKETTD